MTTACGNSQDDENSAEDSTTDTTAGTLADTTTDTSSPVVDSDGVQTGCAQGIAYDRSLYGDWIDEDGDCQNTRAEVLIAENTGTLTYTSSTNCIVSTGTWYDSYTDTVYTTAGDLDVDHMVPLKEAHDSGGWNWDSIKRKQYANDLTAPEHLIAVSASANRSKSASDPAEWMPTNTEYWVTYAKNWVKIKVDWGLTADSLELERLRSILQDESDITYPTLAEECLPSGDTTDDTTADSDTDTDTDTDTDSDTTDDTDDTDTTDSEFTCSGKKTCGEMISCAEARFYLTECGVSSLDGDKDGTPCESICN